MTRKPAGGFEITEILQGLVDAGLKAKAAHRGAMKDLSDAIDEARLSGLQFLDVGDRVCRLSDIPEALKRKTNVRPWIVRWISEDGDLALVEDMGSGEDAYNRHLKMSPSELWIVAKGEGG